MATVTGTAGDDFIHVSGDGRVPPPGTNEVATATNGDDIITSGAGTDIIYAGGGNDQIRISAASDISGLAEYINGGEGNDFLMLAFGGMVDLTQVTFVSVSMIASANFTGLPLNVVLTADQMSSIRMYGGIDDGFTLSAPGAVTYLQPFFDGDLMGSFGDDVLDFQTNGLFTINGAGGNDTIRATQQAYSVTLWGGTGNDSLEAGKKRDTLDGGDGIDVLIGGRGKDKLTGGQDADTFVFRQDRDSKVGNADRITDFSRAQSDLIDLSKIDANTGLAKDQAFHLGGAVFTNMAGELIQTIDGNGATLLQGDTNGDGIADFAIHLAGGPALVASDFIF
jgi:Ca2+-binding RTX toxin-like protein